MAVPYSLQMLSAQYPPEAVDCATNKLVSNRGEPRGPVVAPANPHGLSGVVVAIKVVIITVPEPDLGHELLQVVHARFDFLGVVNRRAKESNDPCSRAWERRLPLRLTYTEIRHQGFERA